MKVCYASRRGIFYPSTSTPTRGMPEGDHRARYLKAVKAQGFDAVEVTTGDLVSLGDQGAGSLATQLKDAGLPAVTVTGGGPVAHPREGARAVRGIEGTIRLAVLIGAETVDLTCVTPPTQPGGPGLARQGEPVSQGSSRLASEADFEATARHFRAFADRAADAGLQISIQVHQGSIADNSWSTLHLLDLIDRKNVGANPDLGNIYWQYDVPEEASEEAIVAMAPRATYWHCKNLTRVHIPELSKSIYLRVPLPDGDIDYRFAIQAMAAANYPGYLAVEGARDGDQLTQDGRSARYVRGIIDEIATR